MASAARTAAACNAAATATHDWVTMVGKARAHVAWALAAAEAGEMDRVLIYLRQTQESLGDSSGPTPHFIPGIPVPDMAPTFARQHSEEAH